MGKPLDEVAVTVFPKQQSLTQHAGRPGAESRICSLSLFAADCIGLMFSALLVLVNVQASPGGLLDVAAATASVGCGAGLLFYLGTAGRYVHRVPLYAELRLLFVTSFSVSGAIAAGALLAGKGNSMVPVLIVCLLFPVSATIMNLLAKRCLRALGVWYRRVLIVGSNLGPSELRSALRSEPSLGYDVVGQVSPFPLDFDVSGNPLASLLARHGAAYLLFCLEDDSLDVRPLIQQAVIEAVPFTVAAHFSAVPVLASTVAAIPGHDVVLVTFRRALSRRIGRSAKVVVDVVVAAILVVVLAPVLLTIAALARMDGGPAVFCHNRLGVGGRPFACYKFRTMRVDADRVLDDALNNDPELAEEWRTTRKLRSDPRVTRLGAFLRKTSLDELPQLINILRLEMSLVGPRPIVSGEAVLYGANLGHYLAARPGLTGLWQVSGRSNTTFETRVKLDTWYVNHWSIWNDLFVLLKTVPAVLFRSGAV